MPTRTNQFRIGAMLFAIFLIATIIGNLTRLEASGQSPRGGLVNQTPAEAAAKSAGCVACHRGVGDMHTTGTVNLGCTDCHGGDATATSKELAHVQPRFPDAWTSSANPVRSYTLLNHDVPEFIRFVNPGDLRVASLSCGLAGCHAQETLAVKKSMMTHGCMLWGAALYNNGAVPDKRPRYGESYSMNGVPQRMQTVPPPTEAEMRTKGVLPFLDPLPRFEMSQPANVLRIFEPGGRFRPDIGIPERVEESGRPRARLSNRGLGTENRTDPVFIGLQKARLLDPTLNFLGTNDHPGDYRSSGCTACHVVYANDRSPVHSGPYAKFGNRGTAGDPRLVRAADPTIPIGEPGHPIEHRFTLSIPTSQCIVCHIHPGTNVLNEMLGFMWWDNETDGELMYPPRQKYPTAEEIIQATFSNPEAAAVRGNWSDSAFLDNITDLNPQLRHTQFADFHGHGWVFRAVYKQDRHGNLLDHDGRVVSDVTAEKLGTAVRRSEKSREAHRGGDRKSAEQVRAELARVDADHRGVPVHLNDIHLEKGMHCIDCHFNQDNHGNTKLYGEVRAAIEIQCTDCHGTVTERASLRTTGPAAPEGSRQLAVGSSEKAAEPGTDLAALRTPFGKRRFERRGNRIYQNSMVEPDLSWELVQTIDTITEGSDHYNAKSALAKTVRRDAGSGEIVWGESVKSESVLAHANSNMSCIACHSAWNPSCFGCHLPQKANKKSPQLHNEGDVTRNIVEYNFQTLRDDVYMLAHDGDVTGNRIGPVRSACAVVVGSYNQNRESIYVQQQTISAEGMSGIAFSTNVPHTVRGHGETKLCTDCHLAKTNDNNAIMAQLLMHGTNYVNFIGKYTWVANGEHGLHAVTVTEHDEPQAVIGSTLHRLAFPDFFARHIERGGELEHAHEHPGKDIADNLKHPLRKPEVLGLQARGEYLYAACGTGGLRVFDIAFIDDKAFAERITTAPVSPLGQRFYVPTKYATAVAAPTTIAPDPTRTHRPENRESAVSLLYAFLYVTDKYEGLILVGAGTLLDGNPQNNFLKRELTFNPNGILNGARSITFAGRYAYICADAGLVVVSLADPTKPEVVMVLGNEFLKNPRSVAIQFRYAFVCDDYGVKVLDVTDLRTPLPVATVPLVEANNIYVARTYAYVAAGSQGLVILDVENPEKPRIDQVFTANGSITDLRDVKLGITYVSEFAYLADGCNGLKVVQLTSPDTPGNYGFSPRPTPELVACYPKAAPALAISKGIDRDRAVDESGNQLAVFGRIGARPLSLAEQQKLYFHRGRVWKVSDEPKDFVRRSR